MTLLYLGLGGALGTLARYGLGGWVQGWAGTGLPWGTLTVNLLGSFVLGAAVHTTNVLPVSEEIRALITVGFCGAFTTFSTYSHETVVLMQEGTWGRAALYAFGSLGAGLLALLAGVAVASLATRAGG